MIDRLVQIGVAQRVPDPKDRRRVIVKLVPDAAIFETMRAVFAPYMEGISAELATHYSETELALLSDFMQRMTEMLNVQVSHLHTQR